MKKLLLLAALGLGTLASQAADYTVYNNGQLGEGLQAYQWWEGAWDFNATAPDNTQKVFSFKSSTQGAGASMGLNLESGLNTGQLANSTLTFDWYAVGTGSYAIKLTWGDPGVEKVFTTVTTENANKWNTTTINVAQDYPEVAENWLKNVNNGVGYIFSIVLSNGSSDAAIYFKNIQYTNVNESWQAPTGPLYPEISNTNNLWSTTNLSVLKTYFAGPSGWTEIAAPPISLANNNISLTTPSDMGYDQWMGQLFVQTGIEVSENKSYSFSMTVKSDKDSKITVKPYVNSEDKFFVADRISFTAPSSYYSFENKQGPDNGELVLILDFGGYPNQAFEITDIIFKEYSSDDSGSTPSTGEGNGKTYKGSVKDEYTYTNGDANVPFTIEYAATWNADETVTFQISISPETVGLVPQLFDTTGYLGNFNGGKFTTAGKYKEGDKPFSFYLAYANGGPLTIPCDYVVGAGDSTQTPGGDGDNENEGGTGATYSGTVTGTFTGAKLTDNSTASDIPFTATYTATWNEEGTVTIALIIDPMVVGLVPQLFVDKAYYANFESDGNGGYVLMTTETFEAGDAPFGLYFAYAGGDTGQIALPYTVGASGNDGTVGVSRIDNKVNGVVEYYNLNGVKVANPQNGIFIRKEGNTVKKVVIR